MRPRQHAAGCRVRPGKEDPPRIILCPGTSADKATRARRPACFGLTSPCRGRSGGGDARLGSKGPEVGDLLVAQRVQQAFGHDRGRPRPSAPRSPPWGSSTWCRRRAAGRGSSRRSRSACRCRSCRPGSRRSTDLYWSEMTFDGWTIDSRISAGRNRLLTVVRSGPRPGPLVAELVAVQAAGLRERSRPRARATRSSSRGRGARSSMSCGRS